MCVPKNTASVRLFDSILVSLGKLISNVKLAEICTISSLPILKHGSSRVCGVCGKRSLRAEAIRNLLPDYYDASLTDALLSVVRCVMCGGKFVD